MAPLLKKPDIPNIEEIGQSVFSSSFLELVILKEGKMELEFERFGESAYCGINRRLHQKAW